ncbi:hypothetical protein C8P63_110129 [Melghirimyces profundicolus]|uniref:Uncharacterized protein n=1 Tax=Melghirimyces profundicolus TaxID=1242148 RepID=A0A2T6BV84_9BACL|nr:hypothetical protein [Melghirimyces profundicolus]PTX59984.1 hypothetical protein C8P63_110129 [Melghirimyces profundicolus]
MKKHKPVMKEVQVVSEWICNKCGKSVQADSNDFETDLIHSFQTEFGYGSGFDMEEWSWELCEDCLVDIVRTFQFAPDGFGGEYRTESSESQQQRFEE